MATSSWVCTVCGYLHQGESPPDYCPICGATSDLFEPAAEKLPVEAKTPSRQWRCLNCDYIHEGDKPPAFCPVCGVRSDQFEPVDRKTLITPHGTMEGSIVIIGSGIAGLSAAEAARATAPKASVTIVTRDQELPYYRLNMTRYIDGEISATTLTIHPQSWYDEHDINLMPATEVTSIDPISNTLTLKNKPALKYDRLILAMGAHPFVPPIPGITRENITSLRTLSDAERIIALSAYSACCVIVGGGVLGLETAAALARRKVQVTLVEGFDWLMPRQLNRTAGELLEKEARALGIELICSARIKQFDGDEQVRSVVLESGKVLPADLVIITAGVRCNSYLARLAGVDVNEGVIVDHQLRTSLPDIYAVGDLAEHQGRIYGSWAPAQFQGTIAGMNAAGDQVSFAGIPRANALKVLGVDMFSIGEVHPTDASYRLFEESGDHYYFFIFRDARLAGAILIGDTALAPILKQLVEKQTNCAAILAEAIDAQGVRELLMRHG